jgi:hypothetical protein
MIEIVARLRDWLGGAPCRIKTPETQHAICYQCGVFHPMSRNIWQGFLDFREKHLGHESMLALMPAAHDQLMQWSHLRPNADVKLAYGTSTSITCTLASLSSSATAGRECTAVDNTSNLYPNALLRIHFKLATGTPGSDKAAYVFLYGSEDGTNYTDNATGSDAAITFRLPTNMPLGGVILCPDSGALTYKSNPIAIAATFNHVMPRKWGFALRNYTGVAGDSTEGNHVKAYSGVYMTVV